VHHGLRPAADYRLSHAARGYDTEAGPRYRRKGQLVNSGYRQDRELPSPRRPHRPGLPCGGRCRRGGSGGYGDLRGAVDVFCRADTV